MANNMEPATSQYPPKNNLLEQTQQQVNEVVGIMRVNVEKVLERDTKLSELDSRADALQEGGKRFEQQAQKLKRKYWWKNLKMMLILGVIGLIILIIIIGEWLPYLILVLFMYNLSFVKLHCIVIEIRLYCCGVTIIMLDGDLKF
ncbi:synaptobrevin family member [Holotrichia oblita]|uniref:Synaptobrevin family member n=1 Tax=Holotrichia oblita TaxID=644536 RepID=A0ACB9SHD0_HOLOL|nr:synaptobrevin family member [Holotrichia oblita]